MRKLGKHTTGYREIGDLKPGPEGTLAALLGKWTVRRVQREEVSHSWELEVRGQGKHKNVGTHPGSGEQSIENPKAPG